jgi:hypothetical protein
MSEFTSKLYNNGFKSYEEFKIELFKFYDVTDNPKANKAFNLAWDFGHSCGYSEVNNYFIDLVELIK